MQSSNATDLVKGGGKIYGVPGPGPEAGGQGLFLGKNMTGEDFFSSNIRGAYTFFSKKYDGPGLFFSKK